MLSLSFGDLGIDEGQVVLWAMVIVDGETFSSDNLCSLDIWMDDEHAIDGLDLIGSEVC